ncbi:MAG: hypothetical protein NDI60_00730 [Elusimicrobiales bacterium]|nr:hypothetical protein [Elusimicrobiales bacterium]
MKKIVLLVSLLVPVLTLAAAAQDTGAALQQLSCDQAAALAADAKAPTPAAAIPADRSWPGNPPPPPSHARMTCRASDYGWEEHWGGHGGGPNEWDACRECLSKHGSCRFDCSVDMVRCEARFNPYNQPQPPYPPQPYPPAPYPPAPYPPAPYPPAPYPPQPPQPWNPGHPVYPPPQPWNPGHPGHPQFPPPNPYPGYPPVNPGHPPHHKDVVKAGPGLYSGDLRPDQRSAEDSAIRNCTQANYGIPGYCSISTCNRQAQSVKSGRCR